MTFQSRVSVMIQKLPLLLLLMVTMWPLSTGQSTDRWLAHFVWLHDPWSQRFGEDVGRDCQLQLMMMSLPAAVVVAAAAAMLNDLLLRCWPKRCLASAKGHQDHRHKSRRRAIDCQSPVPKTRSATVMKTVSLLLLLLLPLTLQRCCCPWSRLRLWNCIQRNALRDRRRRHWSAAAESSRMYRPTPASTTTMTMRMQVAGAVSDNGSRSQAARVSRATVLASELRTNAASPDNRLPGQLPPPLGWRPVCRDLQFRFRLTDERESRHPLRWPFAAAAAAGSGHRLWVRLSSKSGQRRFAIVMAPLSLLMIHQDWTTVAYGEIAERPGDQASLPRG